jgi:hypothetical protein
VSDGSQKKAEKKSVAKEESAIVITDDTGKNLDLSPAELRSKADALFKQAQQLRKKADELDPPKKKEKVEKVVAE